HRPRPRPFPTRRSSDLSAEDERIHSALWSRRAGTRALTPGARYAAPPPSMRYGAPPVDREAARRHWCETLGGVAAREREALLIRDRKSTRLNRSHVKIS